MRPCAHLLSSTPWEAALGALHRHLRKGRAIPSLYNTTLHALANGRRWADSINVLRMMPSPTLTSYRSCVRACVRASQLDAATSVLRNMAVAEIAGDVLTFTPVITLCGSKGEWRRAIELLETMTQLRVSPDTVAYEQTMRACGDNWEQALVLLGQMENSRLQPSAQSYSIAMRVCDSGRRWDVALQLLDDMRERTVEPNVVVFNTILSALEKDGQWQRALEILHRIQSPDVISYNTTISVCSKAQEWELACQLLGQVGCATTITFNAVIHACVNQWEAALSVFTRMHDADPVSCVPDVVTYSTTILALARGKQWERAVLLFDQMRADGVQADSGCCSAVMAAYTESGRWQEALRVFDAMSVAPMVDSANAALSACDSGGQWQRACALLGNMLQQRMCSPTIVSFNAVMSACVHAGEWQRALAIFAHIKSKDVPVPTMVSYNTALVACSKGAQWRLALALIGRMREHPHTMPDTQCYRVLVEALDGGGEFLLARDVYRTMIAPHHPTWRDDVTMDFHSLTLAEAHAAMLVALDDFVSGEREVSGDLVLIVGKGLHSEINAVLKPALRRIVEMEWHCSCVEVAENAGRLSIPVADLRRLVESRRKMSEINE